MAVQQVGKFMIFQSPFGGYQQIGRRLAYKSFQHDVLSQMLDVFPYQRDVFFHAVHMKRFLGVLACQCGTAYDLHLVYLEDV